MDWICEAPEMQKESQEQSLRVHEKTKNAEQGVAKTSPGRDGRVDTIPMKTFVTQNLIGAAQSRDVRDSEVRQGKLPAGEPDSLSAFQAMEARRVSSHSLKWRARCERKSGDG
jgi:hypothetical protein